MLSKDRESQEDEFCHFCEVLSLHLPDRCLKAIKKVIKEKISIGNWTSQEGAMIAALRE